MGRIGVSQSKSVGSLECTGCLDCVASCPVPETLAFKAGRMRLEQFGLACTILLLFLAGYVTGRLSGHWDTAIPDQDIIRHIEHMNSNTYTHPGG